MPEILYKEEVYSIVGCCIDVWKNLGFGFSEVVYKDAMEIEFYLQNLLYIREDNLDVLYKGVILKHKFKSDFTVLNKIIVEVKSGIPEFLNLLFNKY